MVTAARWGQAGGTRERVHCPKSCSSCQVDFGKLLAISLLQMMSFISTLMCGGVECRVDLKDK